MSWYSSKFGIFKPRDKYHISNGCFDINAKNILVVAFEHVDNGIPSGNFAMLGLRVRTVDCSRNY